VQTQVLPYLRALVADGFEIHLLTFERRPPSRSERRRARDALAAQGIRWSALRYHAWPSLPATLYDIAVGALWSSAYLLRHGIRIVHARSHVAAAMGLVATRLLRGRLLFDVRGLLAEEYVDAGHWRAGGLKFRLTKAVERVLFRRADALVMLTGRIRDELLQGERALAGRGDRIEVIPCCVDADRFRFAAAEREAERQARGFAGRIVLAYVGKLGTWYLPREMAAFFAALHRQEPRAYFAVMTQSPPEAMRSALQEAGVGPHDASVAYVPPADLPRALVACAAGVSFIRPSYSKRASSPTKIGEYLAAGLPVVASAGVGDVDALLAKGDAGVIVPTLDAAAFAAAAAELLRLLQRPGTRERCQELARRELGLRTVGGPRYVAVLRRLAGERAPERTGTLSRVD
jgi:glycosyltransferase involved in cell wall biosynthesis